jgi:gluconate 5-dehydrogenase
MNTTVERNEPNAIELFRLQGRVALVTGAGGHLGLSLARALAEAGAQVVVTSRDAQRAAAVANSLPNSAGLQHLGVALDHLIPQSIDECMKAVVDKAGGIDILVNNAHDAISKDWETIAAEEFHRHLSNLSAYFLLARHVRNLAVERKMSASIIMLGSMYGLVGSYPDAYNDIMPASPAAYHALKGGVIQLTRHLAIYWAQDGVRVNCLSPGPFPSHAANPQMVERLIQKSPLRRMGQPHELKGALLLLASEAGSYITGQNIVVDGGWTAW